MRDKVRRVMELLDAEYPAQVKCFLNYKHDYELLVATILSAQCTDDRVNIVTETLFQKYSSLEAFAGADLAELEKDVYATGFYRNKAKNIIASAQKLLTEFDGELPQDIDDLLKLDGVGRKTANVVRGHIYGIPCIVVDTHVKRVSGLLGFTKNTDPDKIEFDLYEILPKDHWTRYNTQIIAHGRKVCIARRPKCGECMMADCCDNRTLRSSRS